MGAAWGELEVALGPRVPLPSGGTPASFNQEPRSSQYGWAFLFQARQGLESTATYTYTCKQPAYSQPIASRLCRGPDLPGQGAALALTS